MTTVRRGSCCIGLPYWGALVRVSVNLKQLLATLSTYIGCYMVCQPFKVDTPKIERMIGV